MSHQNCKQLKKKNGHVHNPQQHNLMPPIENASPHRLQVKLAGQSRQLRPRETVIKATKRLDRGIQNLQLKAKHSANSNIEQGRVYPEDTPPGKGGKTTGDGVIQSSVK